MMSERTRRRLFLLAVAAMLAVTAWSTPLVTYACQQPGGGCG
jgi:hypothetical protein